MSDGNPQDVEPQANHSVDSLRWFQFSLAGLFVVMTILVVILSIFFGVGQLVGMTTIEVVSQGLESFLYLLPLLLVWTVGIMLAVRRLKRNRVQAILVLIALGGMAVAVTIVFVVQMVLVHCVNSGRISHESFSWGTGVSGVLSTVVHSICWILVLVAIFRGWPPNASQDRLVVCPPAAYAKPDEALATAFQLDMAGDWDAAVGLYGEVAKRWPEYESYARGRIAQIEEKRSRAAQP